MNGERGGLLVEHLVAIVILAMVVAATFNFMAIGLLAQSLARDHTLATNLAQRKMEEIRAAGPEITASQPRQIADVAAGRRFAWEVNVVDRAADMKEVTATVYWNTRGRERQVSLVTYVRGR